MLGHLTDYVQKSYHYLLQKMWRAGPSFYIFSEAAEQGRSFLVKCTSPGLVFHVSIFICKQVQHILWQRKERDLIGDTIAFELHSSIFIITPFEKESQIKLRENYQTWCLCSYDIDNRFIFLHHEDAKFVEIVLYHQQQHFY